MCYQYLIPADTCHENPFCWVWIRLYSKEKFKFLQWSTTNVMDTKKCQIKPKEYTQSLRNMLMHWKLWVVVVPNLSSQQSWCHANTRYPVYTVLVWFVKSWFYKNRCHTLGRQCKTRHALIIFWVMSFIIVCNIKTGNCESWFQICRS